MKEFVQKRQLITEKSKETAARLAVMKMRMKAIGEKSIIPEISRVYFSIQLPNGYKYLGNSVAPIFFDEVLNISNFSAAFS